jgi:hypothetical protein
MRKVQEVLRLLLVCGLSQRQASRACGVGRASVAEYLERAQRAGLLGTGWETWSDEDLDRRLYPPGCGTRTRATPGSAASAGMRRRKASRPPAEAPTPTIGKSCSATAGGDGSGDVEALRRALLRAGRWRAAERRCWGIDLIADYS